MNHSINKIKPMARYLDPKTDIVFKRIFGEHPHLLKSFLNAVLPLPENSPIVSLTYLSNEQAPKIPAFKRTIVDVKCTDNKGRVFIVEMQVSWMHTFKQRLLFGASQAVVKQLEKGEDYALLEPVYGLGIIADTYEKETNDWYHHYQLVRNADDGQYPDIIEHLQLVFIELPKFPVISPNDKKLRILWLRFLREIDRTIDKAPQELLAVPEISEAVKLAEEAAYTRGELQAYETYWDSIRRENSMVSGYYRQGLAEGEAKGKEKGKAEGKVEGELEAKLAIAKAMLAAGSEPSFIVKVTQLSFEQITALFNNE